MNLELPQFLSEQNSTILENNGNNFSHYQEISNKYIYKAIMADSA